MKYVIKSFPLIFLLVGTMASAQSPMREEALRAAAKNAGVVPLETIIIPADPLMADIGAKLFESTTLSLNGETSCQTCHLDQFSSADGLPNAVGTGGHGEGAARLKSGGDIVPRNTLPLWGRGTKGFDTFFWDGKVRVTGSGISSQFGDQPPSDDPLVVAAHLPFVEIREMVLRDERVVQNYEREDQTSASKIFDILASRVKADPELGPELSHAAGVNLKDLKFIHIAEAVAAFIRTNFQVKETKFDRFVFAGSKLSEAQVQGGLIFYGKGQCAACHSGPLLSDLNFYVMPFRQSGFGKNGFGVDYGQFNATRASSDVYKFRTPPLLKVSQTAPYTHSGAYLKLDDVIKAHLDPLGSYDGSQRSVRQRREDLAKLSMWAKSNEIPEPLSDREIELIVEFLQTLE